MKKTIIILSFLLLIPLVFAENGCFFFPESPFHCTDLDSQQAQEECSLYSGCLLSSTFVSGNPCSSYLDCQTDPSGKLVDSEGGSNSSILWLLAALILLVTAGYYALKSGIVKTIIDWFKRPSEESIKRQPNFWEYLSPFNTSVGAKYRLRKAKIEHWHKLNEQKRKEFFANLGLALPKNKSDHFTKLNLAYKFYEKHKQKISKQLSNQERKVFNNLEQVVERSRGKSAFNQQKKRTHQEVESTLNELREMTREK